MSGFLTVALVCASTIAAGDCTRSTATDVTVMPANSQFECALGGQATMAASGFVESGTYLKIVCERRRVAVALPRED